VILTVTLNAALDVSYGVDEVHPGQSHRVRTVHQRAGGKGINVARILHAMRHDVLATGLAGGAAGAALRADLAVAGIPESLEPIAGESRRTVSVVSRATGQATLFNEPGPPVTDEEWARLRERVGRLAAGAAVVVLSGSLPPGVPDDAYAHLVRSARAAGAATVVDADGDALRAALDAAPDVVKPNTAELAAASGVADPWGAVEWLRDHGAAAVVATSGADGLIARAATGSWRGWLAMDLVAVNPTGAGDACVAALATGLADRRSWPDMLADAVGWSAASVLSGVAGEVDREELARIGSSVRVEVLDGARLDR
jgi:tagatose 6-phosphate kinase